MNAKQAKRVTLDSLKVDEEVLAPFLEGVYKLIRHAAVNGHRYVDDPLSTSGHNIPKLPEAIYRALYEEGYEVSERKTSAGRIIKRVSW
jgi:hypothetical protein